MDWESLEMGLRERPSLVPERELYVDFQTELVSEGIELSTELEVEAGASELKSVDVLVDISAKELMLDLNCFGEEASISSSLGSIQFATPEEESQQAHSPVTLFQTMSCVA